MGITYRKDIMQSDQRRMRRCRGIESKFGIGVAMIVVVICAR